MFIAQQSQASGWQDYGVFALQSLSVLALIAVSAWIAVRIGRTRLAARAKTSKMKVLERLPLEPKRSLYLVEIEGEVVVIGVSESGMNLIKSLSSFDGPGRSREPEEGL